MGVWLYWGNTSIDSTHINIKNGKIPESFDGFTIVQISDFHNATFGDKQEKLLKIIQEASPDIIVITGDLIDSNRTHVKRAMDMVDRAVTIAPVYYVTGNHEARSPEYEELKERLVQAEVTILDNKSINIEKDGEFIQLWGLDDPRVEDVNDVLSDEHQINKYLMDFNTEDSFYTILLSHRPELFDVYQQNNVDLVFSGHAHGGQIRLPFVGGLLAPNQGFFPKYTNGLYQAKATSMIVSRGLGNSIFPLRINNRPELIVATLYQG